ncbi:MAG TPA: hypothetical protein VLY63_12580, partial [Anaerolineae bacterium]|nr:hypothetical protein [Anaerolineae bacterium]
MRIKRWQIQLLVLLAYTLFALILTWPVVTHFDSHVPGNGVDDPPLTWNLWWVRTSLLRLGTNPFESDYLFYPLGINLGFYTLTVLNGLLSIPLQGVLGLIPATNLLLLSSFILSAYGAFLLASYFLFAGPHPRANLSSDSQFSNFLRPLLVPFTAGLLYSFASSKLAYAALGQWNIASSQWIPFFVLYLFKMGENPYRWHYPLLATLFFLFQAYAELTYATFLILFTALWTIWHVWTRLRSACLWRRVGNLVLVGCTSLLGLIPILAMMIPDMLVEGDIFVESGGFADVFSADLIGFLVPSVYHPILGNLVEYFRFDYSVGQHLYLGYSVLALAVLGIIFARRRTLPVEL